MSACSEIDALMIDWLYQELDESMAASFEEHLAGCARCRAEVESLEQTREAVRVLPELEPPSSVSAILLHEAAKRAPSPARKPVVAVADEDSPGLFAWLGRLFTPIMQHPAAVAVATMVLVAGVAGSLYLRGEHKLAEPTARSRAPSPHEESAGLELESPPAAGSFAATPVSAPQSAENREVGRLVTKEGYAATLADEGDIDQLRLSLSEQQHDQKRADNRVAELTSKGGEGAFARQETKKQNVTAHREHRNKAPAQRIGGNKAPPADIMANAVSGADPLVDFEAEGFNSTGQTVVLGAGANADKDVRGGSGYGEAVDGVGASSAEDGRSPVGRNPDFASKGDYRTSRKSKPSGKKAGQTKSQRADRSGLRDARGGQPAPAAAEPAPPTYRAYKDPKRELQWAKSEQRKLSTALGKQRCRDAARIANDILDRNPDYYYKRVKGSKAIKSCQWYVSNEQKRRSRTRAKARPRKASPARSSDQAVPADAVTTE